ncbi:MAG TPA: glucose-6-phosphate isomerase [Steroidobacteraceae bacterium]|jgi:glucose-6-phosphate isomerase|nr:glucose-6-phosphate isomerase [Steroidobacteraceae bacterium]
MTTPLRSGTDCAAWRELQDLARELGATPTRTLFDQDAQRFEHCSAQGAGLLLDYSRQRVDARVLERLAALADQLDLRGRIEAMFRGEPINSTEGRAVLHTALRAPAGTSGEPLRVEGRDVRAQIASERERMLQFAQAVRSGALRSSSNEPFELVVNIGIGGSDLGPAMAVEALRAFAAGAPRVAFVSNIDGCQLADLLEGANATRTLFIVCSKTFTTLETLTNARTARAWILQRLGAAALPQHFAAVSVNTRAMDEFGVHPQYRFPMWDWVGGRYSVWSAIGVSLAIAIGRAGFEAFLAGGHEVDQHFRSAPWRANLPALAGLLGAWNIDLLGLPTLAVLPYDSRLARLPAYLQQLEMESNGKHVKLDGTPTQLPTCAVIWGEPGDNAQHSFFQLLHQGTQRAALDLLLPINSSCANQPQQDLAIASCLAQAEALALGQNAAQVREELAGQKLSEERIAALIPHKIDEGSRALSLLMFERLDPRTLGRIIALYEHKVFVQSVVWGNNAFDQWGVELGKKLTERFIPLVEKPQAVTGQSSSLQGALGYVQRWRDAPHR